ncbi:MAG: NTP transferase domain-containing protein, partial [Simkaniaceae bacterium]|nr:NTP transferase domain-containing protein [Simkaniaceae bacterium]
MKKIVCVIPARLKSQRFPEKMLANLMDKPLLQWVWESAISCKAFSSVLFAVDDQKIGDLIESFQGKYVLTSKDCQSGTDRLIEVMQKGILDADIWVNWQGDDPLISEQMIEDLLKNMDEDGDIWTLKKRIVTKTDVDDPNTVKVVT